MKNRWCLLTTLIILGTYTTTYTSPYSAARIRAKPHHIRQATHPPHTSLNTLPATQEGKQQALACLISKKVKKKRACRLLRKLLKDYNKPAHSIIASYQGKTLLELVSPNTLFWHILLKHFKKQLIKQQEKCLITQVEFGSDTEEIRHKKIYLLNCGHAYDKNSIIQWLNLPSSTHRCPYCQRAVLPQYNPAKKVNKC